MENRSNCFGGWGEFDPGNILRRDWLDNTGEDAGVTSDVMEAANMKGENTDSYRAFLTVGAQGRSGRSARRAASVTSCISMRPSGTRIATSSSLSASALFSVLSTL